MLTNIDQGLRGRND